MNPTLDVGADQRAAHLIADVEPLEPLHDLPLFQQLDRLFIRAVASAMLLEGRLTPGGRGLQRAADRVGAGRGGTGRERAFIVPMLRTEANDG